MRLHVGVCRGASRCIPAATSAGFEDALLKTPLRLWRTHLLFLNKITEMHLNDGKSFPRNLLHKLRVQNMAARIIIMYAIRR